LFINEKIEIALYITGLLFSPTSAWQNPQHLDKNIEYSTCGLRKSVKL